MSCARSTSFVHLVLACFVVLVGNGFAVPAKAAWTPPTALNTFTLLALPTNTASVAVGPSGDSVAVWVNEADSIIRYAIQRNGTWTTAKILFRPNATKAETTADVRVVVGPDGTASAIFSSTIPGQLQYCVVGTRVVRCLGPSTSYAKVATLVPGATAWSKPLNVSPKGGSVSATQIGLDQAGNAVAAWRYEPQSGAPASLQVATQAAGMAWSPAVSLYTSASPWSLPELAVGPRGDVMLAWQEQLGSDQPAVIRTLSKPVQGPWEPVADAAILTGRAWTLHGIVDGLGYAALVWDDDYSIWLVRRGDQHAWGIPEALKSSSGALYGATGPMMAYSPDLAADAQGNLLVSWSESDAPTGMSTVEAQMLLIGGQVRATSWPTGSAYGMVGVAHAAMSSDGSLGLVGWVDQGDSKVRTVAFTPSAGWAKPVARGAGLWDTDVRLGCGLGREASIVWLSGTATEFKYRYVGSSYRP